MENRVKILQMTAWGLLALIALGLIETQLIKGSYFYQLSANNRIRVVPVEGKRGRILDRNGVVLVDNRVSFDVLVTPQELKQPDELFLFLSRILGQEPRVLRKRFQKGSLAPFAPVVIAQDISREQAFILEENKFRFPSLLIQESYRRDYLTRDVGAHVLGYVGKISRSKIERLKDYGYSAQSIVGYSGVEEYYDQYLKGGEGGLQIEVNSRGQQVRLLGIRESRQGKDVQLTIDGEVQRMAYESLEGKRGAVVVMDVESGEILSLISSPAYDPNIFVDSTLEDRISPMFTDPASPSLNRVIQGLYPPGSVFKIPIAVGALETDNAVPSTSYACSGAFKMGRRMIRCSHVHGTQNLYQAIAHSCNVYFINLGLKLESEIIAKYAKMLGLGQATHIDLPFEENGSIPSQLTRRMTRNQPWYRGDTANMSIGQGDVVVTPIQLMRMMAVIARDGNEIQPFVIKSIGGNEAQIETTEKVLNIKPETFMTVKEGMKQTISDEHGTAHILDMKGLISYGKTGTAQSSGQKMHHSWFAGYTFSDKRKIAYCVFLEYGGSSYYAAQVTKNFLQKMQSRELL